jgi:thioredoxin reductase
VAAAREASARGAEVVVIEKMESLTPPWRSWPGYIDGSLGGSGPPLDLGSARLSLGIEISAAKSGVVMSSPGSAFRADSVVLATGRAFVPPRTSGVRKRGSVVLDSPLKYAGLGRELSSAERVAVCGEGLGSLQVADKLSGTHRIELFVSCWQAGPPGEPAMSVLTEAASEKGVHVSYGHVERVVGVEEVRGVLSCGEVTLCDAFIHAPRRIPNPVSIQSPLGRSGGIGVDGHLRTGVAGVFAAGACAEVLGGMPRGASLEYEPGISGRVAGANSIGGCLSVSRLRTVRLHAFGLNWSRTGPSYSDCRSFGMDVKVAAKRFGDLEGCSIVYERRSSMVASVEVISVPSSQMSTAFPDYTTLRSLAYRGSSDITAVTETARLGMKSWQGF